MRAWGLFTRVGSWAPKSGLDLTLLVIGGQVPVRSNAIVYARGRAASLAPSHEAIPVAPSVDALAADDLPEGKVRALLGDQEVEWTRPRALIHLSPIAEDELTAVCKAVSLLRWHGANRHDGADGTPTRMREDGLRRVRGNGRTIFPRTDPVAIVAVESADGQRCLLGRQRRYVAGMWTCVSGFVEHGEGVEDAAAREVLEETGVVCGPVALVSSQPWPVGRGANCELMLGCVARAATEEIRPPTDELEGVKWFTRDEARQMLKRSAAKSEIDAGEKHTPAAYAIAHHLIKSWVDNDRGVWGRVADGSRHTRW